MAVVKIEGVDDPAIVQARMDVHRKSSTEFQLIECTAVIKDTLFNKLSVTDSEVSFKDCTFQELVVRDSDVAYVDSCGGTMEFRGCGRVRVYSSVIGNLRLCLDTHLELDGLTEVANLTLMEGRTNRIIHRMVSGGTVENIITNGTDKLSTAWRIAAQQGRHPFRMKLALVQAGLKKYAAF